MFGFFVPFWAPVIIKKQDDPLTSLRTTTDIQRASLKTLYQKKKKKKKLIYLKKKHKKKKKKKKKQFIYQNCCLHKSFYWKRFWLLMEIAEETTLYWWTCEKKRPNKDLRLTILLQEVLAFECTTSSNCAEKT